jgi:hypothetical protein
MKKNKLTTAVIAGLAGVAGVATVGNAVHVNPEGTGQALIYPYYSVNNGLNTAYSVVNTTDQVKAVKVRFLEGDHSREVLDFNVYLSPFDVWTGVLGKTTSSIGSHSGEEAGAHASFDASCAPLLNKAGQQFLPYEIDADAPNNNMKRSTDGHFEVLEMGVVDPASPLAAAATHVAGVPNCAAIDAAWGAGGTWDVSPSTYMLPPTGGLFGAASLIDVANGFNVSYDPIALDDWSATAQHTDPGNLLPNIANANPAVSNVFVNGATLTDVWVSGAQAVSATMMRSEVYNEYAFEADVEGKSAWVVTFPTKFHHVNPAVPVLPFTVSWDGDEACEEFSLKKWDREERTEVSFGTISPQPPEGENPSFCQEANTVEFIAPGAAVGDSNILGGTNLISVQGVSGGTENGWARIQYNGAVNYMTGLGAGNTYLGLPTAGFMVQRFTNTSAGEGLLAQYGGLFDHKGMVNSAP